MTIPVGPIIHRADASTKSIPAACSVLPVRVLMARAGTGTKQRRLFSSLILVLLKHDPSGLSKLVPVPELAPPRACGGRFVPVVKECSAWCSCALKCLPCAASCAVFQGSSLEVLLTIGSGIQDPKKSLTRSSRGTEALGTMVYRIWSLTGQGEFGESCEASVSCVCRHRNTSDFFPVFAEFCCVSLLLLVLSLCPAKESRFCTAVLFLERLC